MMSIDDAVDLVLYAFEHGDPGDIFVQKAPAATIETLALALKKLFKADNPVKVIGTRHGEKLYETLLTREEMAVAEDLRRLLPRPGRQPRPELRAVLQRGQQDVSRKEDYNSHNTRALDVDEMADLLLKLECVQRRSRGEKVEL